MSVLSPTSLADSAGSVPPRLDPPRICGEDDFSLMLRRYRLALALFVASAAMLFIGFSSAYVVRRGIPIYDAATGAYSTAWEPLRLPIGILILNTCLLICASGVVEVVRRKARVLLHGKATIERGSRSWLNASLLLGIGFLVGQGLAWHSLASSGQLLSTGARAAFFYVLSGTHAVHAFVGVLAVAVIAVFNVPVSAARRRIAVDVTAWYLHSMTLLWIYLICFLQFA
jgi:cytochrome c oxidase subunit III